MRALLHAIPHSLGAVLLLWLGMVAPGTASEKPPREVYNALNALRIAQNQVYYAKDLQIRRDAIRISFHEGKLAFLIPYDGRVTGAVFTGHGQILAIPRDSVERRSLARFLGEPMLDQGFSRAYFRFTDDSAEELLRELREAGAQPMNEPAFAEEWNEVVGNLNPLHSVRIMADLFATTPHPYFYGGLVGDKQGPFDVLVDDRRAEQVLLGQVRRVGGERYSDIWASFPRLDARETAAAPFEPVGYSIDTLILPDRTLEGTTTLTLKATRSGERAVLLELSRFLTVESAEDATHQPMVFFQNEALHGQDVARQGNDVLVLFLPSAVRAGEEVRLRLAYRGGVISDAGNGVYSVGARGSWYPHVGGTSYFTPYELSFRWPRRLRLVATGKKIDEREEADARIGHWRSEIPMPVAGFNLGEFATQTVDLGGLKVDLYANQQLEQALAERFRKSVLVPERPLGWPSRGSRLPAISVMTVPEAPPSPAALLGRLGLEIADAARFAERFNGPFPYERLSVSQIPGTFGQGWPGLVYLSTLSFLSADAQQRAGLSATAQEQFSDIVPYHEVVHQWWGNLVGFHSYRDQWIQEGLSSYIALLYADSKKIPDRSLNAWLDRFRNELTAKEPEHDTTVDEAGPLVLGNRLRSSSSPSGFEHVIYSKGTWVFHMLRSMLREPGAAHPDARFMALLRGLVETHRYRALSTEELERAVEKVMTHAMALEGGRSMDWFFDQWVRGTGVPHYSAQFTARAQGEGFLVRGKLKQTGVPDNFLVAVPLYVFRPGSKPLPLGTVTTSGTETPFSFVSRVHPKRLLIDPHGTILCVRE